MLEKITDIDTILKLTYRIGYKKRELPFHLRGYASVLGLYVQLKDAGRLCRLEVGGKYSSYFDAWGDFSSFSDYGDLPFSSEYVASWEIRKFDRPTWEHRFAHLLGSTFEIVEEIEIALPYMQLQGPPPFVTHARAVIQALQQAEQTEKWTGVRQYSCNDCKIAVPHWRNYVENGRCPQCGGSTAATDYPGYVL